MAYGLPVFGEDDQTTIDKFNNSIEYVKAVAEAAQSAAAGNVTSVQAASQAADQALERAESAHAFIEEPTDSRVAELVADSASSTGTALSAAIGRGTPGGTAPLDSTGKVPGANLPPGLGGGSTSAGYVPLEIPTYDDNPSVGHPDVVHVPGGWNGYTYWMAFTPFPAAARENPSIVVSNDGVNWEVPAGLTNPVVPFASLPVGYDWWSDTDMVLSPDGLTMMMYFRGTDQGVTNTCYLTTSTDGITWTPFTQVIAGMDESPAVVVEDDGTYTMFSCYDNGIYRRTSTDGTTWTASTLVTTPTLPSPYNKWHIDVVRVDGTYHALVTGSTPTGGPDPYRLFYWTSANGTVFTGSTDPAVPLSGTRFDTRGHYRSTLQPAASGLSGKFDVWTTCMDETRADHGAAIWRIGHIRDFDFSDGESWNFPAPIELPRVVENDERWVMAGEMMNYLGSPTSALAPANGWPAKGLLHTANTGVAASFPPPPTSWHHYTVEALVVNVGDVTPGQVRFYTRTEMAGAGDTISAGQFRAINMPVGAKNVPQWVDLFDIANYDPEENYLGGRAIKTTISRESWAGPDDTFDDTIWVLAFRVRRVRDA